MHEGIFYLLIIAVIVLCFAWTTPYLTKSKVAPESWLHFFRKMLFILYNSCLIPGLLDLIIEKINFKLGFSVRKTIMMKNVGQTDESFHKF